MADGNGPAGGGPVNRSNRSGLFAGIAVAVVIALAVPLTWFVTTVGRRPSGAPAAAAWRVESISELLDRQAEALDAGDEEGWLAAVDPSNAPLRERYRRLYELLRGVGASLRPNPYPELLPVWDPRGDPIPLEVAYGVCLQTAECPRPNVSPLPSIAVPETEWFTAGITLVSVDGEYVIGDLRTLPAASEKNERRLPLWLTEDLNIVSGRKVLVLGPDQYAADLAGILEVAERAAQATDQFAHWTKPTRYVLYIAGDAEWSRWFSSPPKDDDVLGYALTTSASSIPVVLRYPSIEPQRLEAVLRHEFGHVVTLLGAPYNIRTYLTEGVADYVVYAGQPLPAYDRRSDVAAFMRTDAWNGDIDQAGGKVYGQGLERSAAYGIGFLVLRCITDRYGEQAMFDFVTRDVRDGDDRDAAARAALGTPWAGVKEACTRFIRTAVG
jgi:hypothetical protein